MRNQLDSKFGNLVCRIQEVKVTKFEIILWVNLLRCCQTTNLHLDTMHNRFRKRRNLGSNNKIVAAKTEEQILISEIQLSRFISGINLVDYYLQDKLIIKEQRRRHHVVCR